MKKPARLYKPMRVKVVLVGNICYSIINPMVHGITIIPGSDKDDTSSPKKMEPIQAMVIFYFIL
jgi:hypothetical protein